MFKICAFSEMYVKKNKKAQVLRLHLFRISASQFKQRGKVGVISLAEQLY